MTVRFVMYSFSFYPGSMLIIHSLAIPIFSLQNYTLKLLHCMVDWFVCFTFALLFHCDHCLIVVIMMPASR